MLVIICAQGKFDGTVGWLAPEYYRKVHSTVTGEEISMSGECLAVLQSAPRFDSDGTGTLFFRPEPTRTTTAAAPKKKAAEAYKKAEDTKSAAAPKKKAAQDVTHHNFT